MPKVSAVVNIETNQVDLRPADGEKRLPSVCVQQESDGRCQVGGDPGQGVTLSTPAESDQTCACFGCARRSDCWDVCSEVERQEHLATLRYPLHLFPGNLVETIFALCSMSSVCNCACVCLFGFSLQIWNDNNLGQRRAQICPFNSTGKEGWRRAGALRAERVEVSRLLFPGFLLRNVWENVSVSLAQVQKHAGRPLLRWNLSAPCRLDGEVWPCCPLRGCGEPQGLQQHLGPGTWRQNGRGHWVIKQ